MIRLEVIDPDTHHFTVSGDQPFRTETTELPTGPICFVYPGALKDPEQEPVGTYDASLPAKERVSWTWRSSAEESP